MAQTQYWPPSRSRQTLLSFQPDSTIRVLQDKKISLPKLWETPYRSSPPPTLPSEVWNQILRSLSTIALKKLRLVCREWSIIGAAWLFETVYLNCYEKSWAGLVSLSRSRHAATVRSIEWNSMVLYDDFEDAAIWASRYCKLLRGLTHSDVVRFHNTYSRVYRAHRTLLRSTTLDAAAEALQTLRNCHHAIISDDYDFADTCDNFLGAAIANHLPNVLDQPCIWGLRAPYVPIGASTCRQAESDILENVPDFFTVLSQCSNVKSMTLFMWEDHLSRLGQPSFWPCGPWRSANVDPTLNAYVTSIDCRLKSPDRPIMSEWDAYTILPPNREVTFDHFRNFSCLRDLRVEVTLSPPGGPIPSSKHRRETRPIDSEVSSNASRDSSASSHESESGGCDEPFVDRRTDGFTESMFGCLCTPLQLTFSQFSCLRTLTLSNLSLNATSVLCFLCSQQQLPKSSFSLQLQGTVIIYNLVPEVFFDCLKQLNVQICYEPTSTYYYPPALPDYHLWEKVPSLTCRTICEGRVTLSGGFYQNLPERPYPGEDGTALPEQMPTCPSTARQNTTREALIIQDRPNQYQHSIPSLTSVLFSRPAATQLYRLRKQGAQTVWEWIPETDALDPRTKSPWTDTHILHSLRVEEEYGDDGGSYYREDEPIRKAMIFDSQFERAARESHYMQDMLQHYERELLGTDLLDLHRYQFELAVERFRLWEASAMPDTTEYVLHQYETELLGLDLISRELSAAIKEALFSAQCR